MRATGWDNYDDITRMCLEFAFHQYFRSQSNPKHRYVDINPSNKVDLKEWVEVDNDDNYLRKRIKRVNISYRERPKKSKRFTDEAPFLIAKDSTNDGSTQGQWLAY